MNCTKLWGILLLSMVLISLPSCTTPQKKLKTGTYNNHTLRFPGEFEKQQAIWLQWPSDIYNSADPVNPVFINIIKALKPYNTVNLITANAAQTSYVKALLKQNTLSLSNLRFFQIDHFSIWARDVGPIFVKDKQNKLQVVNFGFNNYSRNGSQYYITTESQVDRLTATALNLPVINSSLISEGGAIESNGQGILMTTESVLLTRNPRLTKKQIEDEYKRVLGIQQVIWLKKGLAEDDHITSGHINEFARFASADTILLAQILPRDQFSNDNTKESYRRLEENYNILLKARDQNGKPFHIIRIPMPPTLANVSVGGKIPLRSYLNYAVTNSAVIIQTYWKPGRSDTLKATENQVKATFQKVFPGRTIIGIDSENINIWGGGIHCITQHMPAS